MSENRVFFRTAFTVAAPIIAQNLISTLVSSADTLMLGYVSQDAMSASSLANQLQFVMMMAIYGLAAGASVLVSQYWGKNDTRTIERVLGLALRFSVGIALPFFIAAVFFPGVVMRCFTDEESVIKEGVTYLRIVGISCVFIAVSQIYVACIRSIERAVIPTVIYVVSLVINITLNATFIFGLFGAPRLGLVGVALGTVTARLAELVICIAYSHYGKALRIRIKCIFEPAGILLKDFLALSMPSIINDICWALAASMYSVAMGHLGSAVVAANAVATMAVNIGAMVCRGFGSATTIVVSKPLGAGNIPQGKTYADRMLLLCLIFGVAGMLIIWLIRPVCEAVYAEKLTDDALSLLKMMMIMRGVQLIGESLNTCMICGCFRAGGDARFGMVLDVCYMWLFEVPLLMAATFLLKLPIFWVYAILCFDEFGKMPIVLVHYFRYKWLKNITRDEAELNKA